MTADIEPIRIDEVVSKNAQTVLFDRIGVWINRLVEIEGYADWKNKQILNDILVGLTDAESDGDGAFPLPKGKEEEHELISGYLGLLSTLVSLRQIEFYFRRFPIRQNAISRADHLSTCCELLFSRVYQFRGGLERQLKRLDRRTHPKGLPIDYWLSEFANNFGALISARNQTHHKEAYRDVEIKAINTGDLLSFARPTGEWASVSRGSYTRIVNRWAKQVRTAAEQLDLFVGLVAFLMLQRCAFLPESGATSMSTMTGSTH